MVAGTYCGTGGFSVGTFNINCDCKEPSNSNVVSTILHCGLDIICMQESNHVWESYLLGDGEEHDVHTPLGQVYPYHKFYNSDWNKWAGLAVLSKYPIHKFEIIKETERGWYPAGLVTIDVGADTAGGSNKEARERRRSQLVQLLIVHLRAPVVFRAFNFGGGIRGWIPDWISGYFSDAVKSKRLHEIQTFMNAVYGLDEDDNDDDKDNDDEDGSSSLLPTIVLGDFNERRNNSNCIQYLEAGKDDDDITVTTSRHAKKKQKFFNIPKQNNMSSWKFQIGPATILNFDYDHILYSSEDFDVISDGGYAKVHDECGSDHCLVSATLKIR